MRLLSTRIHGILDYLVAVILIAVPWLFGVAGQNTATYVPVTLGILTILYSLVTRYEWGAIKMMSMPMHLMMDLLSGFLLAISPWLFGFHHYIYMPYLLIGLFEMIVSLITDPLPFGIRNDLEARKRARSGDNPIKGHNILLLLVAGLTLQCSKTKDHDEPTSRLNAKDMQFIVDAGYSNHDEIDAGNLATTKGASQPVRGFGQMMVADHSTAQAELKAIADAAKAPVPDQADSVHKEMVQSMSNLTGTAFDSTYLKAQVTDHQKAVELFRTELSSGQDAAVKGYASKYLPKIEMHLSMADSLLQVLQHP